MGLEHDAVVSLWAIAVIGGPILLAIAFAYGVWRNRRKRRDIEAARHHERVAHQDERAPRHSERAP